MRLIRASLLVFKSRSFTFFWMGRFLSVLAAFTQSVTIGWQVYSVARSTQSIEESSFLVGMVGLSQFLPVFLLALPSGMIADRYDRRKILLFSCILQFLCASSLALNAYQETPSLLVIFSMAALFGVARAFIMPATTALGPMLVPSELLPRAIAWNSLSMQAGMILGPWIGGTLCAISSSKSYGVSALLFMLSGAAFVSIRGVTRPAHNPASRFRMVQEGLSYVWNNKLVFGAISLDLFAVLLGGVTALLPVYAKDILGIGANGFGLLRSGPALGGGAMAVLLSLAPIRRKAGPLMLGAVIVYGISTIIFALSKNLTLSMISLMLLGAADVISVFVRQNLVQVVTADSMRGRVSAVSGLFISASNELGEFESGVVARLIGPVGSALFGGVGSILITLLWAKLFPSLRQADRLIKTEGDG